MIVFENATKRFGEKLALDKVSFRIEPGEFVYILGPSGAGKTTFGRLLIRELTLTEGNIRVGDYDYAQLKARDLPKLRQQIGVVFQDYKLLPDRTAAENIALALEILNQADSQIKNTVTELLKVVGLAGRENDFPSQLSGGETQRVVIARAMAADPPVLFADEPTGNLDDTTAHQIGELLHKINKHGTTVIMATHDSRMPIKLPGRILTLDKGKVIKDETDEAYTTKHL